MVTKLLTGNAAAAWGARLADVDYVPTFPITPQTEIVETLARWFDEGKLTGKFVTLDSEHSMITAAGAAAATGVRTFTATSSQGLVFALEAIYTVAGWRVPMVLVNVSRGLSAPITLGRDHNDVLAARDTGFVQLHAETCQEVLDSVLMAYRISEIARVCLPVLVNLNGFHLSFTRDPVEIPEPSQVRSILPDFEPKHAVFRDSKPVAQGVAVLEGSLYSDFRYQLHRAVENAVEVHREAADDFEKIFGHRYGCVEEYRMDDAQIVLVMAGSFATKAKEAVDRWRNEGRRVGLLRLWIIRPHPRDELRTALAGRRAVGVIDQNISPGLGGILFHKVAATMATAEREGPALRSFIGGLGGKDISQAEHGRVRHTYLPRRFRQVAEYMEPQRRVGHLFRPVRRETALRRIQANVDTYWQEWLAKSKSTQPRDGAGDTSPWRKARSASKPLGRRQTGRPIWTAPGGGVTIF